MKLFISGTGTGVGKTWVSAAMALNVLESGQSVGYYKPIQTGTPAGQPPEDLQFIDTVTQGRVTTYGRYCFEPPAAPAVADSLGVICPERIAQDVATYGERHDWLLVEGAGGLAVPVSSTMLMLDLIALLRLPVLLVAQSTLGTINHTLLSVYALEARRIPMAGVVINGYPRELSHANLAIQTLIPTLRRHISSEILIWTCLQADVPSGGEKEIRLIPKVSAEPSDS